MKTVDLREQKLTVQEQLLRMARSDSLLILAVLEEAAQFEKEAAQLGSNERFVEFLKERSQEPVSISLEEVEKRLATQGDS